MFKSASTREGADGHKTQTSKWPWEWESKHASEEVPLIVNIGNSLTAGPRDPRRARGRVSPACRRGGGCDRDSGSDGEVVGYSGTL